MKFRMLFTILMTAALTQAVSYKAVEKYYFAGVVGQPDSTAVHLSDSAFVSWADGYTNLQFGAEVSSYMDPSKALGAAVGTSYDVLSLGRGGEVTLTFTSGIRDGDGFDFAVFENAFNDYFLELAFVELSSDGVNFVRFPNYSLNIKDGLIEARKIFGIAGKYRQGYGHPFDLNEIKLAYQAALEGNTDFSDAFSEQLTNHYHTLDFDHITHVRFVDAIGDGVSSLDARGLYVADPYPTTGSAGFDLDAVGVLNRSAVNGELQEITFEAIPHQQLDFQTLELTAESDSGLPVAFSVASGPATITNALLYFTGTGTVEVVASQGGNAVYAPASPVLRSFQVMERIQHIFVEPIADVVALPGYLTVRAYSSSGLPVHLHVQSGEGNIDEFTHIYVIPSTAGIVTLRASQPGDASTAPAKDVLVSFQVLENLNGIVGFSSWLSSNDVPTVESMGSVDRYGRDALSLSYALPSGVQASSRLLVSNDLMIWTNAIPEITSQDSSNGMLEMDVLVPMIGSNQFFRVEFDGL